jgi:hemoglobin
MKATMTTPLPKPFSALLSLLLVLAWSGCGTGSANKAANDSFTSGSRDADQRASQRMAKSEQLQDKDADTPEKLSLFERLGGTPGIAAIVEDFTDRALEDPRVNWQRRGVVNKVFLGKDESKAWDASPQNVETLRKHLVQFLSLATGGPAQYDGKTMKEAHDGLKITNTEFDASIGDLQASLDRLKVPTREQKELLAIMESTRPQIATER